MSAVALIPQDTAGLSAFVARKTPSGAQDDDPDADFSAALAQTADASTPLSPATPADAPLPKSGDEIWRRLSAFADAATAPQTTLEAKAPSPQAQGELPGAATDDLKPAQRAPLSKAQPAEEGGGQDARVPTKPDATPPPAPAAESDTAPTRPSRAASSNVTSSLASASPAPERATDKTAAKAPSTSDRTAPKAETAVSTPCLSNPPAACADQGLVASPLPLPPAQKSASASAGPSEPDSVARNRGGFGFSRRRPKADRERSGFETGPVQRRGAAGRVGDSHSRGGATDLAAAGQPGLQPRSEPAGIGGPRRAGSAASRWRQNNGHGWRQDGRLRCRQGRCRRRNGLATAPRFSARKIAVNAFRQPPVARRRKPCAGQGRSVQACRHGVGAIHVR